MMPYQKKKKFDSICSLILPIMIEQDCKKNKGNKDIPEKKTLNFSKSSYSNTLLSFT